MTKLGKIWTDSVAYIALAAGAGLSIAANVADIFRVRGQETDALDITIAVAYPALVVLMVEVFVSSRWRGLPWPMQTLRWLGTMAITAVAMRISWVHGHELMASRGQPEDVATLGPLAIDFLAIMATALILAGRGQMAMAVAKSEDVATAMDGQTQMATDGHGHVAKTNGQDGHGQLLATDGHVATTEGMAVAMATHLPEIGHKVGQFLATVEEEEGPVATQPLSEEYAATLRAELEAWESGAEQAITDAGQELATEAEIHIESQQEQGMRFILPNELVDLLKSWNPEVSGLSGKDVDRLLAAYYGKSERTARRWRSQVTGQPTSGGR